MLHEGEQECVKCEKVFEWFYIEAEDARKGSYTAHEIPEGKAGVSKSGQAYCTHCGTTNKIEKIIS